jgi:hypothetical protein
MASDQPDPKDRDRDFALTSADLGLYRYQVLSSRLPAMAPSSSRKAGNPRPPDIKEVKEDAAALQLT